MKLMQLRYFSAVCHLGGVTRAAERLHVSQQLPRLFRTWKMNWGCYC